MAGFKVLLDDLGIETISATCTRSQVLIVHGWGDVRNYGAVGVIPVSVDSTTSGTLKGAAWGVFLAGPLGAAVGSMVGGGMKVAFELHTLEGEVLRCIAGKDAYLDIKKQVETRPAQPKPVKTAKVNAERVGPRRPGALLIIGMILMPLLAVWFFLMKGFTPRARAIAAVWTTLWCVAITQLPTEPAAPPTTDAPAAVAEASKS